MKLWLREWIVVTGILGFLGTIILISAFSQVRSKKELTDHKPPSSITITLLGAVNAPGEYQCVPGTSMKELLKKTGLKSTADRKKISFKRIFFHEQVIEIPEKKPPVSIEAKNTLVEN
ncbi:MAG: hypothetical protein K1000chlam2_01315 [Chlamydiae bacterium]|nr:hypothetical protein [Chlamydiota bacterium]